MAEPILLYGPIWAEVAEDFTKKVVSIPESEAIDIWINSPGGSVDDGWSMLAILQNRKEVNMKVMGDASSMAFFMLLFATHISVVDTVTPTIHRAARYEEEELTENEKSAIVARNVIIRQKMEARINEAKFFEITGKTFDDIFSMRERLNVQITAQQGVDIGLFDEIITIDVNKKKKIESVFLHEIAALAQSKKEANNNSSINSNKKDMSLLKAIFGEKDPILLGKIDENQFAYSKIEIGAKVKAIGEGEKPAINGTFEANDKTITVVENEITAVVEVDNKQIEIDVLTAKISALTEVVSKIGKDPVKAEVRDEEKDKQLALLTSQVDALTKTIEAAKLSVSNPELPVGDFKGEKVAETIEMSRRERMTLEQQEIYEAKQKEREGL